MEDNCYVIGNIFTNKQRKELLEISKSILVDGDVLGEKFGDSFPGKQSHPFILDYYKFKTFFDIMESKIEEVTRKNLKFITAWANWTNGKKKDVAWHNHPKADYTFVYYLKLPPFFNNGTLVEEPVGLVKTKQNSLLLLPGKLYHTAPSSPLRLDRYTLAGDLVYG